MMSLPAFSGASYILSFMELRDDGCCSRRSHQEAVGSLWGRLETTGHHPLCVDSQWDRRQVEPTVSDGDGTEGETVHLEPSAVNPCHLTRSTAVSGLIPVLV